MNTPKIIISYESKQQNSAQHSCYGVKIQICEELTHFQSQIINSRDIE